MRSGSIRLEWVALIEHKKPRLAKCVRQGLNFNLAHMPIQKRMAYSSSEALASSASGALNSAFGLTLSFVFGSSYIDFDIDEDFRVKFDFHAM